MTYTHNSNGVCFDCDHNPRGSAPNLLNGGADKKASSKRTQQRRYKNMSTYTQKLETVRAQTEKTIVSIKYAADAKIESIQNAADAKIKIARQKTDAKIARLNALLDIEIARVEAIDSLDTHETLDESEAEPDMNTQTEMEA